MDVQSFADLGIKMDDAAMRRLREIMSSINTERETMLIEKMAKRIADLIASRPPPRFVYLAGPIMGCTVGEANDWRRSVCEKLAPHNIIGVSPLRCEPLIGDRYSANYPDPRFGTPRAISAKNRFDVAQCDLTLACLPKPLQGRVQSYGTLGECFWADSTGKQVILCTDDPVIINHPVVDSAIDWKFTHVQTGDEGAISEAAKREMIQMDSLAHCIDAACETIIGVLGGYTGGKNV